MVSIRRKITPICLLPTTYPEPKPDEPKPDVPDGSWSFSGPRSLSVGDTLTLTDDGVERQYRCIRNINISSSIDAAHLWRLLADGYLSVVETNHVVNVNVNIAAGGEVARSVTARLNQMFSNGGFVRRPTFQPMIFPSGEGGSPPENRPSGLLAVSWQDRLPLTELSPIQ